MMRVGDLAFKQQLSKRKTSFVNEITLLFPGELKQSLLQIITSYLNNKDKLHIECLRKNFPNVYWSLIFYFELNNIDKTFMLPYTKFDANRIFEDELNKNVEYINSKKEENLTVIDLNVVKDFNLKTYIMPNNNEIKKYNTENLCIQNVYDLGLINNILYSYINIFSYQENIGYNELPMIIFETEYDMPSSKIVSDYLINDNVTYVSVSTRDSTLPQIKRHSDSNILINSVSTLNNLGFTKVEVPTEHRLLAKNKKNPLEDHIFDFESSDDNNYGDYSQSDEETDKKK